MPAEYYKEHIDILGPVLAEVLLCPIVGLVPLSLSGILYKEPKAAVITNGVMSRSRALFEPSTIYNCFRKPGCQYSTGIRDGGGQEHKLLLFADDTCHSVLTDTETSQSDSELTGYTINWNTPPLHGGKSNWVP